MLSRFDLTRAAIALVAAGLPASALAQVKDVSPYHAFVISDADLRAGDTAVNYRVGTVKGGTIVLVDGESPNWSRLNYPADAYAFVRLDDATYDAAAKELKLAKPSRLVAANSTSGFNGSWKALLVTALPAGTTLRVLQVEDTGSGPIGYRVPAPAEARAFTESKNLRKATPAEVSAFRSAGGTVRDAASASASPAAAPASTAPFAPAASNPTQPTGTAAATPAPTLPANSNPVSTPTSAPVAAAPAASAPAVDTSLVSPVNTSGAGGAPSAPVSTPPAPTSVAPGVGQSGAAPVTIDQSAAPASAQPAASSQPPAAPVASPAPVATPAPVSANMRAAARIRELDQAFDRVNSQPLGEAEYETLIAEYERTIQQLSGQLSPRQKALLEQRLNILKFRKDLRQKQLALLNESGTVQQQNQQVLQSVAQVEATRVYSIVGQLQPSTVYNGQTLPLMFRIQSVGTSVPRTLGYIKPDPRFALESKLGQIVGVIGETSMDRELKLNVITPVRIDLLQGIPMPQTQQPAVQIPPAPSGQLPPVQMPEQGQQLPPRQIEVTK